MPEIGQNLSHYNLVEKIGKGGMGEVFRAKDQKLGRNVAIKVLPAEFARDTERVARFQREAKLLASLNHPNIAAIHGLEESDGTHFLVLELVEGDTLSDRIKARPIPVEDSLKLALQIAEALEAAHEKGVIHRDLKPSNIKVTPEGKVKVLDFGLAKAFAGEQEEMILSDSPTISAAATQKGVILGTAAYMSPEQAKGKTVDRQTDIWAFGAVLYEMLTGQAAFKGDEVSEILASVIKGDTNLSLLPENIHPRVRELLSRCLQKDLKERYRDIGDAQFEIKKVLADPSGVFVKPVAVEEPQKKSRLMLLWASITAILIIIAGIAVWNLRTPEPRQVMRFDYELPEDHQLMSDVPLGISPDGKQIVYCTPEGLYLRSVDELNAKLIPGSDVLPRNPFFSPDGKSIGFFSITDRKLKRIAVGGGAPIVLCGAENFLGANWGADDFIVYSTPQTGIMRISSNGGTPETLVEPKSEMLFNPQILPGGKALLYTVGPAQARIMAKSLKSEEPKELFAGWLLRYLPSGHIVYWDTENNLCAVQFDLDRLETAGQYVSMIQSVDEAALSNSGTLIYTLGVPQEASPPSKLVWVNRKGEEEPLDAPPNQYNQPKISPDGTRVALVVGSYPNEDIYVWDIERNNLTKLTLDTTRELTPIWTPDSKRIIYWSTHEVEPQGGIYWRAADGSGKVEKLASASDRQLFPWSISRDGKNLLIQELVTFQNADIGVLSMEDDHERKPLLQNEYSEAQPKISPDGRWLAYSSSESTGEWNRPEVYVRPFPEVEESKTQVSNSGGHSPLWSPDGRELYYLSNENDLMVVSVKTEPNFSVSAPRILFRSSNLGLSTTSGTPYDIHPDGKRFLMIKPPVGAGEAATATGPRKITIVLNWDKELKERVPVD